MPLTSYSELVTAAEDWLNRADQNSSIPDFLALAEAHFNRELRHPSMIATATTALEEDVATYALPTDFLEMREVYIDGDPDRVLVAHSATNLRTLYPYSSAGISGAYAISAGNLILAPVPSSADTLAMVYYQSIPALTASQPTNWLLTTYPDLYLRAIRYFAYDKLRDDASADKELAIITSIITSINQAGVKAGIPAGPLAMRSTITGA